MELYDISIDCLYSADQTGLFYETLPNHMYIDQYVQDYQCHKVDEE